jgi:small basic protein
MSLGQAITQFFGSPGGTAILLLFALAALDFVLGTLRAISDNVFQLDSLAAWVRKHIAGRVLPITAVLVIAHLAGGLSIDTAADILAPGTILTTIGLGMAGSYVLETIASVRESLVAGTATVPQD